MQMKLLKKRVNIIAIMMFIVFAMMLLMDFSNSFKEETKTIHELAQTEQTQSEIIADLERR